MNVDHQESVCLIEMHTSEANYALSCKQTQIEIANKEPLYTFGDFQTKQDWLKSAEEYEKIRQFNRTKAQMWIKYLNTMFKDS